MNYQNDPITRLSVKKPTAKEIAKWKNLVDICVKLILSNPSRAEHCSLLNKLDIKFNSRRDIPKGWPRGRKPRKVDGGIAIEYNPVHILWWLWERKLTDYTPTMLYKERRGFLLNATRYENYIDNYLEEEYNVSIECDEELNDS